MGRQLRELADAPCFLARSGHVPSFDLVTYCSVVVVIAAMAGVGSYLPARRAADLDPMIALKRG